MRNCIIYTVVQILDKDQIKKYEMNGGCNARRIDEKHIKL
jgi:hypothetical protein